MIQCKSEQHALKHNSILPVHNKFEVITESIKKKPYGAKTLYRSAFMPHWHLPMEQYQNRNQSSKIDNGPTKLHNKQVETPSFKFDTPLKIPSLDEAIVTNNKACLCVGVQEELNSSCSSSIQIVEVRKPKQEVKVRNPHAKLTVQLCLKCHYKVLNRARENLNNGIAARLDVWLKIMGNGLKEETKKWEKVVITLEEFKEARCTLV